MYGQRKLNSGKISNEAILWMVLGPILLILIMLSGFTVILLTPFCLAYAAISALMFIRTRNAGYMVRSMFFGFALVLVVLLFLKSGVYALIAGIISAILLAWLLVLMGVGEFRWRHLRVLEMAAIPVEELDEAYSMRPKPVGKLDAGSEELLAFARFIRGNLISVVYIQKDKVVFGLSRSVFKMITFSDDFVNDTWVSVDRDGNVSAHISREDHERYRDSYALDQLADSLGKTFMEFFRLHREGKGAEITGRLDSF